MVPRLFVPAVSCPGCEYPHDKDFRFCQRCGYRRQTQTAKTWPYLKAAVNWEVINERKRELNQRVRSTPYSRQKSSLENELSAFLRKSTPSEDIITATPDDVIHFLIWKDSFGKTIVHKDNCPHFGDKKKSSCSCPRRLAFSTVDSIRYHVTHGLPVCWRDKVDCTLYCCKSGS